MIYLFFILSVFCSMHTIYKYNEILCSFSVWMWWNIYFICILGTLSGLGKYIATGELSKIGGHINISGTNPELPFIRLLENLTSARTQDTTYNMTEEMTQCITEEMTENVTQKTEQYWLFSSNTIPGLQYCNTIPYQYQCNSNYFSCMEVKCVIQFFSSHLFCCISLLLY